MKRAACFLAAALLLLGAGCRSAGGGDTIKKGASNIVITNNPIATIEMEDGGVIRIELYYDKAPNTVKNFIHLANSGFYDGLSFTV